MVITSCYSPNMNDITPFGAALYYYRKKKPHFNQEMMGDAVGVSQAMISKIEKGLNDGSAELREKIVKYFKIPYSDFLAKGESLLTGTKTIKSTESPPVGNIIRVYNNILERTGLELDEEGQEKLFNLIKRRLSEKTAEAAEKEITEIISLTDKRKKG